MTLRQPAKLIELQDKYRQGLQYLLNYMLANADQALLAHAGRARSNAEQNLYFESMRELRFKRRGIERFFFDAAGQGLQNLLDSGGQIERESVLETEQEAEDLSLLQEETLEDVITVDNMAGRAEARHHEALVLLGDHLVALLGIPRIPVKDNPLGPRALCVAFLEVCSQLEVGNQSKQIFSRLFERFVLGELEGFYNQLLGVFPDEEPELAAAEPAPAEPAVEPEPEAPAEEEPDAESSLQWNVADTPLLAPPGKAPAMPRALLDELLQNVQQRLLDRKQAPAALHPRSASVILPIYDLLQEELEALQYSQAMAIPFDEAEAIQLVGLLFEHMLKDARIPAPGKRLLKLLHVPILRAAIKDAELMNRADHPARQLLNDMTGACVGWEPAAELGNDPLYVKLQEAAHRVVDEYHGDQEVIETALLDLQTWLKAERHVSKLVEQRTINAESGRANAAAARERIRGLLGDEMSGVELPDPVTKLLKGPWSDALFVVLLQDGEECDGWIAAQKTTQDLIESVQPLRDEADRKRFLHTTPATMRALRRGLGRIKHAEEETDALIAAIEAIHLRILESAPATDVPTPEPDTGPKGMSESDKEAIARLPKKLLQQVDSIPPDTWVEFRCGRHTGAARLLTRIPVSGKLLFVNRSGVKVAEWGRDEFALALSQGKIVLLGGTRLFDQALRSLGSS